MGNLAEPGVCLACGILLDVFTIKISRQVGLSVCGCDFRFVFQGLKDKDSIVLKLCDEYRD